MKLMARWSGLLLVGRTVSAADGTMGRTPVSGAHCISYRWGGLLLVERTVSEFPVEHSLLLVERTEVRYCLVDLPMALDGAVFHSCRASPSCRQA